MKTYKIPFALDVLYGFITFFLVFATAMAIGDYSEGTLPLSTLIIFLVISSLMILYGVYTVILQFQYKKTLDLQLKAETSAELETLADSKQVSNDIKGAVLENLIKFKLIEKYPNACVMRGPFKAKANDKVKLEIDVLLIDEDGIFIIEAKNFSNARLTGDWGKDENLKLTYKLTGFQTMTSNPVLQNSRHYEILSKLLLQKDNVFRNVVVLGDFTDYDFDEWMATKPMFGNICRSYSFENRFEKIKKSTKVKLSPQMVKSLRETIDEHYSHR